MAPNCHSRALYVIPALSLVIPAKAGIQWFIPGFRVKPGMTEKEKEKEEAS